MPSSFELINAAEIAAAKSAQADLAIRKAAALETKTKLEPSLSFATQMVSKVDQFTALAKKIGLKSPKALTPKIEADIANIGARKTELISTVIDPYNAAVATLGLADITIPAAQYKEVKTGPDLLTMDAFALIESTFRAYDLEELAPMIQQMMEEGVGPERAALLLKTDPKYNRDAAGNVIGYQKRFYGNELRRKAGLNVINESAYLALENSYSETLKAYGQENYFGTDKPTRQAKMAQIIGGDVSAKEFQDRVILAVDRVKNSDYVTRTAFSGFYGINDNDLVAYFLNPKEVLPMLQEKVVSAEIGGAALLQGLEADRLRSEELSRLGVTKQSAQEGYKGIASVLPVAQKLSSIYQQEGITYTQTTGEQEAFLGLESARRAREKLISREIGTFSGKSGTAKGALTEEKFV